MALSPIALYDLLAARVSESDLKQVAFRLRLRYENLAGATLSERMLALIQYGEDHQVHDHLLEAIAQARPDLRAALFATAVPPSLPAPPPANAAAPSFDVFLAHNSQDKPQVERLAARLKARGLQPWLDQEQIPPGRWFQDLLQAAIPQVKAAAIILGPGGIGRWQAVELRAFISQCVEHGTPVIPVLLPGVAAVPDTWLFLQQLHAVTFHDTIDDPAALDQLVWGITGQRPA